MKQKRTGIFDHVLAAIFAGIVLVIAVQVVFRYVLGSPLSWPEELARYLFTWLVFVGAALALRDRSHIRVEILVERLPRRWQRIFETGSLALQSVFLLIGTMMGVMLMLRTTSRSSVLDLPERYVYYGALPVAFALGTVYTVTHLVRDLRTPPAANEPGDKED